MKRTTKIEDVKISDDLISKLEALPDSRQRRSPISDEVIQAVIKYYPTKTQKDLSRVLDISMHSVKAIWESHGEKQ